MREEHVEGTEQGFGREPGFSKGDCTGCLSDWPCQTLRLAEKYLKLAEAMELIRTCEEWDAEDNIGSRTPGEVAERVLADCAEEGKNKSEPDLPAGYTRVDPADGFGG